LTGRGEPSDVKKTEGRFIFNSSNYLDPQVYKKGRQVTVAGKVIGEESRPVGEMNYRYPVIQSQEVYLWEDYSDYPPYYPESYFSSWNYYHRWWGYPYRYYGK
jgi:outer membrane lipoprotein